jgi:homoserine kinase type II
MAIKTDLTDDDFSGILSAYDLGSYIRSEGILGGTVQTNYIVHTSIGKFVFRLYENRSRESVFFERDVLLHLGHHDYPCPTPIPHSDGSYVGTHLEKPYAIFKFLEGTHTKQPNWAQWQQVIQKATELHILTENFSSPNEEHRWNYNPGLCAKLAGSEALKIGTQDAQRKLHWLEHTLESLDLPPSLPMGVCHCDFDFSNLLFKGDELAALLDFDDANRTYLLFDLIHLIENWAWEHTQKTHDLEKTRSVIQEYERHRPLSPVEKLHLFDVYKLSILIDCIWFFDRGSSDDFYEKRKIDIMDQDGRQVFCDKLFGK